MTVEDLVSTLQELAEVLQSQRTLGGALASIAEAATVTVPGCAAASVTISLRGRPATAASTARVALELDLVQYDAGDGPCLTSFATMSTIRIDLVESGEPFPHVAVAAQALGINAVLSVPATWDDEAVATINLYSRTGPFDRSAAGIASVLASQVAIAVSRSPEYVASRTVVEQAQRDADDLAEVNLAAGLLMINEGCTAQQAEGLLRNAAAEDEQSILRIARRIIDQHRSAR